ncbi:MAG: MmgE/PrpD family protein [Oceanospirillaceae bacterium]
MAIVSSHPMYQFIDDLQSIDLPAQVIQQSKICLADLLATLAAGSQTELAPIVNTFCTQQLSASVQAPRALPLTSASPMSPAGAALLDAMVIDSMDAHDGHSLTKGHVGCAVIATLNSFISSAQQDSEGRSKQISGRQLLGYLIAGYEIGTRCGIVLHESCSDYHSSGAWNAVTCAALTGHYLGLDRQQFEHALGIAEYHGPRSQLMRDVDHPTMVKDGSGWGAMAGVSAAYMAQLGFTGAPAITVFNSEVQGYWQDLGSRWRILEQYIKPYPVCRWAHPAIDAVLALMQQHNIASHQIVKVTVHTFHHATRLSQQLPETSDQAQYGIVFPLAIALCHGNVLPKHLHESALNDAVVVAMFKRIEIVETEHFSQLFPAQRQCQVDIETASDTYKSAAYSARGEPQAPLSKTELLAKYMALTTPVWGEQRAIKILDAIDQLDTQESSALELLSMIPRQH